MINFRLLWMFVGALSLMAALLLTGATDIAAPAYGRYQVSSWSTNVANDKAVVGAFVIDTATGETKNVYTRLVNSDGMGRVLRNDLGQNFYSIK